MGPAASSFRTRLNAGRWTAWRPAAPEAEDLPDAGSAEAGRRGNWHVGNPWWVGPSDRIELRVHGTVSAVRAFTVWSPAIHVPSRMLAAAGAPPIVTRAAWHADESIRRGKPSYASSVRFAVVHHTAGRSDYTRAEAAAIVRGIQLFHVQGNGWNDIGYNFLVDRFGTVYEGRYGGIERNVVGAHAQGLQHRFGRGGRDRHVRAGSAAGCGRGRTRTASRLAARPGSRGAADDPERPLRREPALPAGIPVFLRGVSGHRDTGFTACPGDALYARLNAIAGAAEAIGLPKLYEPRVTGMVGGLVRFRARLSAFLPWQVAVRDVTGAVVATAPAPG